RAPRRSVRAASSDGLEERPVAALEERHGLVEHEPLEVLGLAVRSERIVVVVRLEDQKPPRVLPIAAGLVVAAARSRARRGRVLREDREHALLLSLLGEPSRNEHDGHLSPLSHSRTEQVVFTGFLPRVPRPRYGRLPGHPDREHMKRTSFVIASAL